MTRQERASGLLSSVFGVACVAVLLGIAVNVCIGLWMRSTVDAMAYDAARDVATTPPGPDRAREAVTALRRATDQLGSYGQDVSMDFESMDGDVVVLHVRAPGLALLPSMIEGGPTVGSLDRRVVVRSEDP